MDDTLLGRHSPEIQYICDCAAEHARTQMDGRFTYPEALDIAEKVARAQLRKVVEWWEKWRCANSESNPCQYAGYDQNICMACKAEALVQALRAAAEEVK